MRNDTTHLSFQINSKSATDKSSQFQCNVIYSQSAQKPQPTQPPLETTLDLAFDLFHFISDFAFHQSTVHSSCRDTHVLGFGCTFMSGATKFRNGMGCRARNVPVRKDNVGNVHKSEGGDLFSCRELRRAAIGQGLMKG